MFPVLGRRGITISAISGIDCALWDILGKSLGVPVWRLLGGRPVADDAGLCLGRLGRAGQDRRELLGYVERGGFRAVKMRVGIIDGEPRHSARRVHAARAALGPDMRADVRCARHLSVAEAKRFCRLVEDCNLAWFEEPVTADDKAGLCRRCAPRPTSRSPPARANSPATISAISRCWARSTSSSPIWRSAAASPRRCGFPRWPAPINLKLAPHLWAGAPAFAAGLHVAAASPAGFIVEYSLGANPLLHDLVEE